MADDLKKKLMQYGDKVLFGIFVFVLVTTAAFTLLGGRTESDTDTFSPGRYQPGEGTLGEQIAQLSMKFDSGELPEAYVTGGFATDPDEINPHRGEKQCEYCGWIVPKSLKRCPNCRKWFENDDDKDGMPNDWEDRYEKVDRYTPDADKDPDGDSFTNLKEYLGGSDPDDPKSIPSPFRLTKSYRKPIDIRFKGYIIREGGDRNEIDPEFWVLQMNYGRASDTAFIPLGGFFHGYRLYPLDKKKRRVEPGGGIPPYDEDIYVLSIKRRGQEPIKLEKDKWATTNETYVNLLVTRGKDSGKVFKGRTVGDVFVANGQRFDLIEMRGNNTILRGSEGEIYTLY